MQIKKYSVYCTNEVAFVTGYGESEPTTCYHNNEHKIDTNQTKMVDIVSVVDATPVKIIQADGIPSGYFSLVSFGGIVPANSIKEFTHKFKIPVNMFEVTAHTRKDNVGDSYDAWINKNTAITLISQSGESVSVIEVADTTNIQPGWYLSLDKSDQYFILSKTATTVTIDGVVSVSAGEVVYTTYYLIKNREIYDLSTDKFGASVIGAFGIPANSVGGITYYNNTLSIKKIMIDIETTF